MDEREFDDERSLQRTKTIVLSDGREYTHKQIFEDFINSRFEKDYMKEAMYMLLLQTPIKVEVSSKENGVTIDIERHFKRKHGDRDKSKEVSLSINGISSDDPKFHTELEKVGEVFLL